MLKSNVIHIISGLSTGGAEKSLLRLIKSGLGGKYNSYVISLLDEGVVGQELRQIGIPVSALGLRNIGAFFAGIKRLRTEIRKLNPGIIQGWMYHGNFAAIIASKFAASHVVTVWNIRHSLYDLKLEKSATQKIIIANKLLSAKPDSIIYNSLISKKQHEGFGFASIKGRVIPNGVDVKYFSYSKNTSLDVRSMLDIPADAIVVGHVARYHPIKNHSSFIRVAVEIACRYLNVHFILIGNGVTEENYELKKNIPCVLHNRFHLLGERKDINILMNAFDVLCQSSLSEAFPNVLVEAMSTCVPCVATDVGDSAIIIGETGLVVPKEDDRKLFSGLNKLITMPLNKRLKLGNRARERILTEFTLDKCNERYVELYDKLLDR